MFASEVNYPLLKGQLVVVQDEDCAPGYRWEVAQFSHEEPEGTMYIVYRSGTLRRFYPKDIYVLPVGWNAAGVVNQWKLPIPPAAKQRRAIRQATTQPIPEDPVMCLVGDALAVRAMFDKCPICGAVLRHGDHHKQHCRYYAVETASRGRYFTDGNEHKRGAHSLSGLGTGL